MKVSVIVPTYRRVFDLSRCLDALWKQSYPPYEVIVVIRADDIETFKFTDDFARGSLSLRIVLVSESGVIAAMNMGLSVAKGDVIALTDDDAIPRPDWLERIKSHFEADPHIGGVGGRDWQPKEPGERLIVGKLQWWGRVIGNHHLGIGDPREVDIIKGANCAYRAEPLRSLGFDVRLLGSGAQVHWELALGLAFRRAGWKLIYDPAVAVDHYPAQRFGVDHLARGGFNAIAQRHAVHNETLILLEHMAPVQRIVFALWSIFIGTRVDPGVLQVPRLIMLPDRHFFYRWSATLRGRAMGMRSFWQGKY